MLSVFQLEQCLGNASGGPLCIEEVDLTSFIEVTVLVRFRRSTQICCQQYCTITWYRVVPLTSASASGLKCVRSRLTCAAYKTRETLLGGLEFDSGSNLGALSGQGWAVGAGAVSANGMLMLNLSSFVTSV